MPRRKATLCSYCGEEIQTGERADTMPHCPDFHRECLIRSVVGSVGHLEHRCSCYGGDAGDPPGMTRREAAKAAWDLWRAMEGFAA
jgi:hypothetical protein